jgi:hypothetical protein
MRLFKDGGWVGVKILDNMVDTVNKKGAYQNVQ